MPELKRTFQSGKMNRNQDERLVRPGEYREALNINIGRSESADIGAVENILGNVQIGSNDDYLTDGQVIGFHRDNGNERIYFFVTTNTSEVENKEGEHAVYMYEQGTGQIRTLAKGEWLNFHPNYLITGVAFVDDLLFWTDDRNEPRKINVTRAISNPDFYDSDDKAAIIKIAPLSPPRVTQISTEGNTSSFLQDKFVRFAYRYKFNDGEFSTISPLTPICFTSIKEKSLTNTDYAAGQISEFINNAKQVFLEVDVPQNAGITGVEILYNESSSTNIYILEELAAETESALENPDPITVSYTYDSQDPFRALPSSQITRVYDAVPRLAKSLEFAGGRLIFGDFLRNFNLPSISFQVEVADISDDDTNPFNRQSVKSQRTYQVGIVLADKFGRQSPVILSSTGGDTIFVDPKTGTDAMQRLTITINNPDAIPDWAYSYRVVVKQRQQEYYNYFFQASQVIDNYPLFEISGGNINKVPRDTTDETVFVGDTAVAQSIIKVLPKLQNNTNFTTTEVLNVDSILYGGAARADGLPDAIIYNSGMANSGSGVFETVPRESQLDIFYETSTVGLVDSITADAINVDFFNCYILNVGDAHLELNRIRAGFNEQWFTVGLKAYAVQENFSEERRFNALIHSSGLFSSRVGQNNVNQFNEAGGGLIIGLDPADGSIQKLYAEDTQLIIFQEDKVSRSPIDKNFIYSAEGGAIPVTSSTEYLGTISPYAGEYGISKNPESFAVYGTRKYFTDAYRGVALRLGGDGLTEISEEGMVDFFRDALEHSTKVIGSFDEYHDQYNVTIHGNPAYGGFEDTNIATGKDGYFTVSFEEEVNGWPSFKSFRQDGGATLNNRYYTLADGKIWEHNHRDAEYNVFYGGERAPSYIECIFNDQPSDIKQFKTVNYEGKFGWECTAVETDIEQLQSEPEAAALSNIAYATLRINGGVDDGSLSGIETQTVVQGSDFKWVIKITPSTSEFVFTDTDQVSITSDDLKIENIILGEDGNIYFITETLTIEEDTTYEITVDGAAARDTSGAILIVRVINDTQESDVVTFIPAENEFRGGPNVFEFVSGADNPRINLSTELAEDSPYEFAADSLEVIYSDNILDLRVGDPEVVYEVDEISYEQNITLPSIQTNGTVTIQQLEDTPLLRLKPGGVLNPFTLTGSNYSIKQLVDGELIDFVSATEIERIFSGNMITWSDYYVVPDFDDDGEYVIVSDDDLTYTANSQLSTYTGTRVDNHSIAELIGAYELDLVSVALAQTDSRFDESHDISVFPAIAVTVTPADQWTYDSDDITDDAATVTDLTTTLEFTVTDFKNGEATLPDGITIQNSDNEDVTTLEPDGVYTIHFASDLANDDYTITIEPQNKEGYRSPESFTDVEITITINVTP